MGILDTVMNMAERQPEMNEQQHSSLISAAMERNATKAASIFLSSAIRSFAPKKPQW